MKKILSGLLSLFMIILLYSCEDDGGTTTSPSKTAPVLNNLAIGSTTTVSITLNKPSLSTAGNPTPTVEAYIGLNGTISVSGVTVTGSTEGPVDVTSSSYQFQSLTCQTSYRIIVVAENTEGSSVEEIVQNTEECEVTTIAGPAPGATTTGDTDATGNDARFNKPYGLTTDGTNLFIADTYNNKIRKIVIATGVVTTLAGPAASETESGDTDETGNAARFYQPYQMTTDGTNLYVADTLNNKIRKIEIESGEVTTLAGPAQGLTEYDDTDGIYTAARFHSPVGIVRVGTNLYVADMMNHKIRKIVISSGEVTTFAGPAQDTIESGSTNGTGNDARFNQPCGLTTDGTNLYLADYNNNRIRKIVIETAVVTTFAGSGLGDTDGTGTAASFNHPPGITSDGTNLYVADYNNHKIRKIVIGTAVVTTLAGPAQGTTAYGDTDGSKTDARFKNPTDVIVAGTNLFVADYQNSKIRKIAL